MSEPAWNGGKRLNRAVLSLHVVIVEVPKVGVEPTPALDPNSRGRAHAPEITATQWSQWDSESDGRRGFQSGRELERALQTSCKRVARQPTGRGYG
jgi:hypothetical protein